jgi:hypothetical protein
MGAFLRAFSVIGRENDNADIQKLFSNLARRCRMAVGPTYGAGWRSTPRSKVKPVDGFVAKIKARISWSEAHLKYAAATAMKRNAEIGIFTKPPGLDRLFLYSSYSFHNLALSSGSVSLSAASRS